MKNINTITVLRKKNPRKKKVQKCSQQQADRSSLASRKGAEKRTPGAKTHVPQRPCHEADFGLGPLRDPAGSHRLPQPGQHEHLTGGEPGSPSLPGAKKSGRAITCCVTSTQQPCSSRGAGKDDL